MVPRTGVLVDAIFDAHHALACAALRRAPRPDPALPFQLALAFGDDDLESGEVRGERFVERRAHPRHVVAVDGAQPAYADAAAASAR